MAIVDVDMVDRRSQDAIRCDRVSLRALMTKEAVYRVQCKQELEISHLLSCRGGISDAITRSRIYMESSVCILKACYVV